MTLGLPRGGSVRGRPLLPDPGGGRRRDPSGLSVQRQEGSSARRRRAWRGGPRFPTRAEAETELAAIETEETQTFCITGSDATLSSDVGPACFPTAEEAEALLELTVPAVGRGVPC